MSNPDGLAGPWFRVDAIQAPVRGSSAEWDFVTVLPAALSAALRGQPFVVGWLHRGGGSSLELVTNAGPVTPGRVDGQHDGAGRAGLEQQRQVAEAASAQGLLFPAGAHGTPVGDDWLAELDAMAWTVCPSRLAIPAGSDDETSDPERIRQPTLFESTLATLMGRPFGWLVVAEPTDSVEEELAQLRSSLDVMRRFDESSERYRFEVERFERRMTEVDAYREAGLWDVRVLAGAGTTAELRQVAPVLVGSVETRHHPYRLRAGATPRSLRQALAYRGRDEATEADSPFRATAGAIAALASLPRREVPGLRVLDTGHFDVTSETAVTAQDSAVHLGEIVNVAERPVGELRVPLATLNRHAFVAGSTGAGKSQTVRHLLEQLAEHDVPWLVIEPAKSEYAGMAGRLAGRSPVTVIKPTDPTAVPVSVNPLAPERGYPVQAHIDMVRALFQAAFDAQEPFPQVMAQALQRVYEDNGWDVVTGGAGPGQTVEPAVPTLGQLQDAALRVISDVGYGKELMSDVRGFVDVRLRSLRVGAAGRFFEGGHPADIGELLTRNVVLAIEDVANDEDKAFLIGTLLIRIVEHLRLRERVGPSPRGQSLRHVLVIEEAHRLLRDRGEQRASSHAVELFAGMLAETRAYGEGVLIAEQIPTKLIPDVVKNTALKVVHRLPAHDDRHVVGSAMNLDEEQSRQVVALPPGVAAVFTDGMDRPLRVRVPLGEGREGRVHPEGQGARPQGEFSPPIAARRSAGCGSECATAACTLAEMRGADLAARDRNWAWLRVWVDTLVLAFVTNRPLPAVPPGLAVRWPLVSPRTSECLLGSVVERCVSRRAWSLRTAFDPNDLVGAVAGMAQRALAGDTSGPAPAGGLPGPSWVIPQVRWLHELERLFPYGRQPQRASALAPPLDYQIPGLVADGSRSVAESAPQSVPESVGQRLQAMRVAVPSMQLERNRAIAWHVLYGGDDHAEFLADLSLVASLMPPELRTGPAAEVMEVGDWLDVVLSWPHRFARRHEDGGTLTFVDG